MEDPSHGPYNVEVAGLFDTGDIYYQCIDLVLERAGEGAAGGGAGAPGSTTSSTGDGGCGVAGAPNGRGASSSWLLVAGMAAWLRTRRSGARPRRRPHSQPGSSGSSMQA
jgi:hypothetical protein